MGKGVLGLKACGSSDEPHECNELSITKKCIMDILMIKQYIECGV